MSFGIALILGVIILGFVILGAFFNKKLSSKNSDETLVS